jgi:gliding motility-associated-like protein
MLAMWCREFWSAVNKTGIGLHKKRWFYIVIRIPAIIFICCLAVLSNAQKPGALKQNTITEKQLQLFYQKIIDGRSQTAGDGLRTGIKTPSAGKTIGQPVLLRKQGLKPGGTGIDCTDSSFVKIYDREYAIPYAAGLARTKDGGVLISGAVTDTIVLRNKYYAFIAKLNSKGNLLWIKEFKDSIKNFFNFYNLYETSTGDIIACGNIDYPVKKEQDADYYTVVTKLTGKGDIVWQKFMNSKLEKGNDNCKGAPSLLISSVTEGIGGDYIFCGTSYGCVSPMYETVFLTDNNGNIKWDFSFMHAAALTWGISAVLKNGNILASGIGNNIFSGGDNTIELHFVTLDYADGKILSTKAYKNSDADYFSRSFAPWAGKMVQAQNGHFYIYGETNEAINPDTAKNEIFAVLDFDSSISFVNGYTVAADIASQSGQSAFYLNTSAMDAEGRFSFSMLQFPSQSTENVYSGSILHGKTLKNKKASLTDTYTYGNTNLIIGNDKALWFLENRSVISVNHNIVTLRKLYDSDTSKLQCLGKDTPFTVIRSIAYIPYNNLFLQNNAYKQVYTASHTIVDSTASLLSTDGCTVLSKCDTIKIHGQVNLCGSQPTGNFTIYKNPGCGALPAWSVDTAKIKNITYINDTAIKVTFKGNWSGHLYATIQGASCALPVTDSVTINVQTTGSVLNLGPDTTLCAGNSITLQAGHFVSYKWQDNKTDSFYAVTQPGTYAVSVTDYCNNKYSDTIKINPAPASPFSIGKDTSNCNAGTITLTATAGFNHYRWGPAYNITGDTSRIVKVSPAIDTAYTATAEKFPGCFVHDTIQIKALQSPRINLGIDTAFCAGQSIILDAGTGFKYYQWSNGAAGAQIIVNQAGYYSVMATAANGCPSYDTLQVTGVHALPIFTLGNDTVLCEGQQLAYQFNLQDGLYKWNTGATTGSFVISNAGTYSLAVTQQGCTLADTITVVYNPLPVINLGNDTTLCNGVEKLLEATGNGQAETYLWQDGSTAGSYNVRGTGNYFVTVTSNGCSSRDSITIKYLFKPAFALGNDTSICTGEKIELIPGVADAAYQWQDGSIAPTYTVVTPGVYSVTVTNGCGSSHDDIRIDSGVCVLLMPNAFTPNHDGVNDIFRVKYPGFVKQFHMAVYSRWGQVVFETSDVAKGWDGTYNGKQQPMGSYAWYITLTGINGVSEMQKGMVTIIR